MAYKRPDRPNRGYQISPTLPAPWFRVGPWQTALQRKRDAEQIQSWIQDVARMNPAIIDALVRGDIKLMDAWVAKQRGTLDELLAGVGDPFISDAVGSYRPHAEDSRVDTGLDQLLRYAPGRARLSWLEGSNISGVYAKALETRKPNTVYRSLHRAVRELLVHHLDSETVRARMEGVKVPSQRDVRLTPLEVRTVLDATPNDRFRWMVALAMLTTADRSPLLRLTPRHYREGLLTVPDTKTRDRRRVLRLSEGGRHSVAARLRGRRAR